MHSYAVESGERQILPPWVLVLAVLTIVSYIVIDLSIKALDLAEMIPGYVRSPSVLAIYAGFYKLFDGCFWKVAIFRLLRVVKVPNMNGTWKVEIVSSESGNGGLAGDLIIDQTWTRISITLDTDISQSWSLTAAINARDRHTIKLTNEYEVERKAGAPDSLARHVGTNRILFTLESGSVTPVSGEYYTERNRGKFGHIRFKQRVK